MSDVPDLQYLGAVKAFDSMRLGSLPTFYENNNLTMKKYVLSWLLKTNEDCWADGLYQLGLNCFVGTQWRLRENLEKYDFSAVFLVENLFDPDEDEGRKKLRKLHKQLKEECKEKPADVFGQRCAFVTGTCKTDKTEMVANDVHRMGDNFPLFLYIMGHPECGPVLYVQYANKGDFMSFAGRMPTDDGRRIGRGPKKMPEAAFALAVTHSAIAFEADPQIFLEKLWRANKPAWYLVWQSLNKITSHWNFVKDWFGFRKRTEHDRWQANATMRNRQFPAFNRLIVLLRAQFEAEKVEWKEDN